MSESILDTEVATFPCVKGTGRATQRPLSAILYDIKSGAWAGEVFALRRMLEQGKREDYDQCKTTLSSFFMSGAAVDRNKMLRHSGFIQVDMDKCGEIFEDLRAMLARDPHAAAVFTSPSGEGIKVLFRVATVENKDEHKAAFEAVSAYIEEGYGMKPDPACKNWNRHCLVSHDPALVVNLQAEAFDWRVFKGSRRDLRGGDKTESSESSKSFCIPLHPLHPSVSSTSHPSLEGYEKELKALEAEDQFKREHPEQAILYDRYLTRIKAETGRRYEALTNSTPFLFRAVSVEVVALLLAHFYDRNPVFRTPREEHMREVEAMLLNLDISYPASLSPIERAFYERMAARQREVFRICRDLAVQPEPEPSPLFPLSDNELARRLGVHPMVAMRELTRLKQLKLITVERPHRKGSKGVKALATVWRWSLPLPVVTPAGAAA